jgi:phospholipase C
MRWAQVASSGGACRGDGRRRVLRGAPPPAKAALASIEHVVVIAETQLTICTGIPGANGIAGATSEQYTQVDYDGTPLPHLPPVWKGGQPDPRFPRNLPNRPFRIDAPPIDLPLSQPVRDLIHSFYPHQEQINGGRNDRFVEVSDAGALAMGHYDGSSLQMWKWAREYTLADNFFQAAYGNSLTNHFWLVCACTPRDERAPASWRAQLDERGWLKRQPDSPRSALTGPPKFVRSTFTPDGYLVGGAQPPFQPSLMAPAAGGDPRFADPAQPTLTPQTAKTIGDTLSANLLGVVRGPLGAAMGPDGRQAPRTVLRNRGEGAPFFIAHHQPFNYFLRFAPGTADRERHLKDYTELLAAIDAGTLPQVAFYKPQANLNQHPGYTDVLSGDRHIGELIARIKASPAWPKVAIIVAYDENGGFWDHVPPPKGDRWGPGTRVPAIVVSPFARRGFVDHTSYDTTSIIKFITRRFGLEPLPGARANAGDR